MRAYVWGAALADREGLAFDRQLLWTASLMHDVGLTRIARNTMCFEVEGGEIARRFLERAGLSEERADAVAVAILLHMQPGVTLADGPEALLLDRSTSLDVRGEGYDLVDGIRDDVHAGVPAQVVRSAVPRGHRTGRSRSGRTARVRGSFECQGSRPRSGRRRGRPATRQADERSRLGALVPWVALTGHHRSDAV